MAIPTRMAGMVLTGHGGLDKLEWHEDLPVPQPGPDEVLIKVLGASVNNSDINTRIAWYSKSVRGDTASGAAQATADAALHDGVPDFAGQRVRQASVVVQVIDGAPSRMVHSTFSILDIKADGYLDVDRLNTQQIARLDLRFDRSNPADEAVGGPVSTLPRGLSLGAAPGSLTPAFCVVSKPPRWDKCRALGFDWFGDELEERRLIGSAALMSARLHARRPASDVDLIA